MNNPALRWLSLTLAFALVPACSGGTSTNPDSNKIAGKITAKATGIALQTGNVYFVVAYAYDWSPGASGPPVAAAALENITVADFSSTAVLHSLDAQGNPAAAEKTFDPGGYSVVFFVSVPANPPRNWAEVRVDVGGDKTVNAPAWAQWNHP